jgi:cephalosporin hydroxylase
MEDKKVEVTEEEKIAVNWIMGLSGEKLLLLAQYIMIEMGKLAIEANAEVITMSTSIKPPNVSDRRNISLVIYQKDQAKDKIKSKTNLFQHAPKTLFALEDLVSDIDMILSDNPDIDIPSLSKAKLAIIDATEN